MVRPIFPTSNHTSIHLPSCLPKITVSSSLIPRPSIPPVFAVSVFAYCKRSKTRGVEGLGTRPVSRTLNIEGYTQLWHSDNLYTRTLTSKPHLSNLSLLVHMGPIRCFLCVAMATMQQGGEIYALGEVSGPTHCPLRLNTDHLSRRYSRRSMNAHGSLPLNC